MYNNLVVCVAVDKDTKVQVEGRNMNTQPKDRQTKKINSHQYRLRYIGEKNDFLATSADAERLFISSESRSRQ